jgi:Na+-transporting NADH:ubiquinone oxidoreductase subunit B/electron transport complex protein RnfD
MCVKINVVFHEFDLIEKGDKMSNQNVDMKQGGLKQYHAWIFLGALAILLVAGIIIFGLRVLLSAAVSIAVSFVIEIAFARMRKKPFDKEWLITPLLIVLILPPGVPVWLIAIATFFGVFFGKNIFGGSGKYIFTPALVGFVFVLVSFPVDMATNWLQPGGDLFAGVTPLRSLLGTTSPYPYTFNELLLGGAPGATGETLRIAVIILGVLLLILKVREWVVSVSYLGFFALFAVVSYLLFEDSFARDPLLLMMTGSILFGALFIASDPVIAPKDGRGQVLFGLGLAIITFVIRFFGTFPEGVMFSILLMSAVSPLIDNLFEKKEEVQA